MIILCDQHLGVSRVAGTTPTSVMDLRSTQKNVFKKLMYSITEDVVLLGDLFDKPQIDNETILTTFNILARWLRSSGSDLYLVRGNHDICNNADRLASIDVLAALLGSIYPDNFNYITEATILPKLDNTVVIPHLRNQDLFDLEVSKYSDPERTLLAHCNYDLFYAENSDHSLNLSKKQAKGFKQVIIGHEHHGRVSGNVTAIGCQFPTSVADVKGNADKAYLKIGENISKVTAWESENNYCEVDWTDLSNLEDAWEFIRVVGEAKTGEAGEMLSAIAKLRKRTKAFVIANAVEIEGVTTSEEELDSLSTLDKLDIVEMLLSRLLKPQASKVKEVCGL